MWWTIRATDRVQLYGDACPKPVIKKTEIPKTRNAQRFGILQQKMISAEFDIDCILLPSYIS